MSSPSNAAPRRWRPRFHLSTLMLVFLVCSVTAAGGRYLFQGLSGGVSGRAMFLISILVLPMLLLFAVNASRLIMIAIQRRGR